MKRYSPMEDPYVSLLLARLVLQLCLTHGRRSATVLPALRRSHLWRNRAVLALSTAPGQALLLCLGSLLLLAGGGRGAERRHPSPLGVLAVAPGEVGAQHRVAPSSPSGVGWRGLQACFSSH